MVSSKYLYVLLTLTSAYRKPPLPVIASPNSRTPQADLAKRSQAPSRPLTWPALPPKSSVNTPSLTQES